MDPFPTEPVQTKKSGIRWGRLLLGSILLSVTGGVVYLSYGIYEQRNPNEQAPADPTKKTLVILGSGWGSVSLLKKLDTENYNVIVVSPRNYFLFTPLLPSCPTGTIEHRSIMEPIRHILRHKKTEVKYYEAEATEIDHEKRVVKVSDLSDIKGDVHSTEIPFDYLVVGVGAESATFGKTDCGVMFAGIPGVKEHACFLKEIQDSQKLRKNVMDCIETALFKEQSPEEVERLLSMVVVGGGPTGVEFAAELQDFFENDLKKWMPELADKFKVTLVEALPNVLPMFSKALIDYTEKSFRDEKIDVRTKTMVKNVGDKYIDVEAILPDGSKEKQRIPYGCLVWATGNAIRPVIRNLMNKIPEQKTARRGLAVNDYLVVDGTEGIWAVGDCAQSKYAPTAQVASQQGAYLARLFNSMERKEIIESEIEQLKELEASSSAADDKTALQKTLAKKDRELKKFAKISSFEYTHQGSLAYIGMDRAVADVSLWGGNVASAGGLTFLFWRSAYLSMVFSTRNRVLVIMDWLKVKVFGRDVSRFVLLVPLMTRMVTNI
ncbi:FAD/NAD(P)-binding domain-containing protein [Ascobolus immersus RN42]|uniref:NADH:ubiquinone reductase (non-electrogenic) n=1 Tax=Ascobolus immersus RN42 TaxID=1160509 RepID=A0A3N4HWA6_ASCIM|nr:FAD/NAD(P)-binding domain-containing protein [Ascobolus immersus RN42]